MSLLGNIWVRLGLKADDFNRGLDNAEKKTSKFGTLMKGVAARVLSVAAAFKAVASTVRTLVSFEASVSKLASVLGKTAGEISGLTQSAIDLGRKTQYTASEVVGLQTELAKLGFTEVQIKSMQESVLKFAAAVGTDLPSAAARAGATMRGFGLTAEQTGDLLEVMAVSTSKSALSFSYLDSTLGKLVPVTKAYGFDAKDTITLLGTLANAGIDASSAGTALRRVFAELANSGSKLNNALGKQPKTMQELIAGLQKLKAGGLGVKESFDLVGKYAGSAFAALVNGADDCAELYAELQNTNGALDTMYETMTQNVTGAVNKLKSAWEGFILNLQASNGVIARMVTGLTRLVSLADHALFAGTRVGEHKQSYDLRRDYQREDGTGLTQFEIQSMYARNRQRLEGIKAANKEGSRAWKNADEELQGLIASENDYYEGLLKIGDATKTVFGGTEGESDPLAELIEKLSKGKGGNKENEELRRYIEETQAAAEYDAEMRKEASKMLSQYEDLHPAIKLTSDAIAGMNGLTDEQRALLMGLADDAGLTTEQVLGLAKTTGALVEKEQELNEAISQQNKEDFLKRIKEQEEAAERMKKLWEDAADAVGGAIRNGIIDSFDELAEAIGTGDWDTTALVKALLTPLADAAISAGTIILTTGESLTALKTALLDLFGGGPQAAVLAGGALIAAGIAVKAGLAALASGGSKGSAASGGGNPYTYTGGYGSVPLAGAGYGSSMELSGTVTVKGQDLQIALDNYNKNRKR